MTTVAATSKRLAYFVDRDDETAKFLRLLDTDDKRVLTITGSEGLGKSMFMERMVHESALRGLRTAKVICRDTRNDPLFIMRSIRDDVGLDSFSEFTRLVNEATRTVDNRVDVHIHGTVNVGAGLTVESGGQVRDVVGVGIRVPDQMFERPDLARRSRELLALITDEFLRALQRATTTERIVVFVDDCQKMAPETHTWVKEELIYALQEGTLPNAFFVLLTRPTTEPPAWNQQTERSELQPLSRTHIATYLERRGVPAAEQDALARMLFLTTKGRTSEVAYWVEAYLIEKGQGQP